MFFLLLSSAQSSPSLFQPRNLTKDLCSPLTLQNCSPAPMNNSLHSPCYSNCVQAMPRAVGELLSVLLAKRTCIT